MPSRDEQPSGHSHLDVVRLELRAKDTLLHVEHFLATPPLSDVSNDVEEHFSFHLSGFSSFARLKAKSFFRPIV